MPIEIVLSYILGFGSLLFFYIVELIKLKLLRKKSIKLRDTIKRDFDNEK